MNRKLYVNCLILMASMLGSLVWGVVSPLMEVRAAGIVFYVKAGGSRICSDWAHACDLQAALTKAGAGDEIWVAAKNTLSKFWGCMLLSLRKFPFRHSSSTFQP